jgi:hypothetical protein
MKKQFSIALLLIVLTLIIAFITSARSSGSDYTLNFGLVCCSLGLLWVLAGVVLAPWERTRNTGYGFLISAGITFLIGTGVCSTMLM